MRSLPFFLLIFLASCAVQKEFYNMLEVEKTYVLSPWEVRYKDLPAQSTIFFFNVDGETERIKLVFEGEPPVDLLAEFTNGTKNPTLGGGDIPASPYGYYALKRNLGLYSFQLKKNKKQQGPILLKALSEGGFNKEIKPTSFSLEQN